MKLSSILNDPSKLYYFKLFVTKLHCAENLLFWLDVEGFYTFAKENEVCKDVIRRKGIYLWRKYLRKHSKRQISLPSLEFKKLKKMINNGEFRLDMFKPAQIIAYKDMKEDTYPKFIVSDEYRKMVKHNIYTQPYILCKSKRVSTINNVYSVTPESKSKNDEGENDIFIKSVTEPYKKKKRMKCIIN